MLTKSLKIPLENLHVLFHKQIYFNMTSRYACTCTCQNERFRINLEVAQIMMVISFDFTSLRTILRLRELFIGNRSRIIRNTELKQK